MVQLEDQTLPAFFNSLLVAYSRRCRAVQYSDCAPLYWFDTVQVSKYARALVPCVTFRRCVRRRSPISFTSIFRRWRDPCVLLVFEINFFELRSSVEELISNPWAAARVEAFSSHRAEFTRLFFFSSYQVFSPDLPVLWRCGYPGSSPGLRFCISSCARRNPLPLEMRH